MKHSCASHPAAPILDPAQEVSAPTPQLLSAMAGPFPKEASKELVLVYIVYIAVTPRLYRFSCCRVLVSGTCHLRTKAKQVPVKVQLNRFQLHGHTIGFHPQSYLVQHYKQYCRRAFVKMVRFSPAGLNIRNTLCCIMSSAAQKHLPMAFILNDHKQAQSHHFILNGHKQAQNARHYCL